MRTHPALATAVLAGWILATPPTDYDALRAFARMKTWAKGESAPEMVRVNAPRKEWDNLRAFDTADACEHARQQRKDAPATFPLVGTGAPPTDYEVFENMVYQGNQRAECLDASVFGH